MKTYIRLDRALLTLLTLVIVSFMALSDTPGAVTTPDPLLHPIANVILESAIHAKLPDDHPDVRRADAAAHDVTMAVDRLVRVGHLPAAEADRWRAVAFVWGYYEASWMADPPGSNDAGHAAGVMQVHVANLPATVRAAIAAAVPTIALSPTAVRKNRAYGFLVGLELLLYLRATCGGVEGALTAYSTTGACATYVLPLVRTRCALVPGGCA